MVKKKASPKTINRNPMTPTKLWCQEASALSHNQYIPCNRPTMFVVKGSDVKAYNMCQMCADHNVANRGARIVQEGEQVEIWDGPESVEAPSENIVHVAKADRPPDEVLGPMVTLPLIHEAGWPVESAMVKLTIETKKVLVEARDRGDRAADLIQIYSRMVTVMDILSAQMKEFGGIISLMKEKLIPEAFERDGVQTLTSRDGDRVTVVQKLFASLVVANREAAYTWLRENGHGAMITETVNASSLSAFARAELAEGREIPENIFTVHMAPSTSLTRKK